MVCVCVCVCVVCACVYACACACVFSPCVTPVTSSSHKSQARGFSFRNEPSRCQTIRVRHTDRAVPRGKHSPTQTSWSSLVCVITGLPSHWPVYTRVPVCDRQRTSLSRNRPSPPLFSLPGCWVQIKARQSPNNMSVIFCPKVWYALFCSLVLDAAIFFFFEQKVLCITNCAPVVPTWRRVWSLWQHGNK